MQGPVNPPGQLAPPADPLDVLLALATTHPRTGERCIVLDGTKTGSVARCDYLFALSHLAGWGKVGTNADLAFGSAFHAGLEKYAWARWAGKGHQRSVMEAVVSAWKLGVVEGLSAADPSTLEVKTLQSLARTTVWAADGIEARPVKGIAQQDGKGPLVEMHFLLDTGFRTPVRGIPLLWAGYVDEVLDPGTGVLWVGDHKTTKRAGGKDKFKPHWALPGYILAVDILVSPWNGLPCRGALVNEYAVQVRGSQHRQEVVEYSTRGSVVEWLAGVFTRAATVEMNALRNSWPQNPDSCYICGFRGACASDPGSRLGALEQEGFQLSSYRWDPSKPRVPWGQTSFGEVPMEIAGAAMESAGLRRP